MSRRIPISLSAAAIALAGSCLTEPSTPVAAVVINVDSLVLEQSTSISVTALVQDAQGNVLGDRVVSWSSTDSTVAGVTGEGLATVTAVDTGFAFVVATAGGVRDSVAVTVHPLVATLAVEPDSLILVPAGSYPLVADAIASSGDTLPGVIRWRTTDSLVVTMAGADTAVAVGTGTARLIATAGSRADTVVVEVAPVTFTRIIAGDFALVHTCAITTAGAAYCWGAENETGALGTGVGIHTLSAPVRVRGGLQFSTVAMGDTHTCGLTTAGAAYCWGYGVFGRIGNPAADPLRNPTPVPVAGGHTFVTLTTGYYHNCALTAQGEAWCWGNNNFGQSGAAGGPFTSPTAVSTALRFTTITAAQFHTCALGVDSLAYCWGSNSLGQLGDSSTVGGPTPEAVYGGLQFVALSAGWLHTCGLTDAGTAFCWGDDSQGALGNGDLDSTSLIPVPVSGGLTFTQIEAGYYTTCGIVAGGAAYCWGDNTAGQLGTGDSTDAQAPRAVAGGLSFAAVLPGDGYACGITMTNRAYCWGKDAFGVLGNGPSGSHPLPSLVLGQP